MERPKSTKVQAELLFSSPGAGRTRDNLKEQKTASFTPEITKVAKRLPVDEKLKGGARLYAKSQSRELDKPSASWKTKEEQECTFSPVRRSVLTTITVHSHSPFWRPQYTTCMIINRFLNPRRLLLWTMAKTATRKLLPRENPRKPRRNRNAHLHR